VGERTHNDARVGEKREGKLREVTAGGGSSGANKFALYVSALRRCYYLRDFLPPHLVPWYPSLPSESPLIPPLIPIHLLSPRLLTRHPAIGHRTGQPTQATSGVVGDVTGTWAGRAKNQQHRCCARSSSPPTATTTCLHPPANIGLANSPCLYLVAGWPLYSRHPPGGWRRTN